MVVRKRLAWWNLEPTYEELKLNEDADGDDSVTDLEPTYEELKPRAVDLTRGIWTHLEPTYEELKPVTNAITITLPAVFRAYL